MRGVPRNDEDLYTEEYPLETRHLTKGTRISAEQIAHATGVPQDHRNFGLAMLRIKGYVAWKLAERGIDVVIRSDKQDLVLLTDDEAAPYTDTKFQVRIQQAALALREQLSVDRGNLKPGDLAQHDRACAVNGATLAGAKRARRAAIAPVPRERLTPGK